jgi:catechol 2,3-dioxygenase-like lactoylglutathione lyase family enzyme
VRRDRTKAEAVFRLEMVTIPVSDVDRAKAFYAEQVGFSVQQDGQVDEHHRFVELLPPGSQCSASADELEHILSVEREDGRRDPYAPSPRSCTCST